MAVLTVNLNPPKYKTCLGPEKNTESGDIFTNLRVF